MYLLMQLFTKVTKIVNILFGALLTSVYDNILVNWGGGEI